MMTKRIIFGVLAAAMIVTMFSCKKDNAPGAGSQAQSAPAVNPLSPNPQQGTVLENSVGIKLVWIRAGEFEMGSDDGESHERPIHTVKITKGYYMGIYEVTQEQYRKVMGTNPSGFKGDDNLPVETVSWNDAVRFCEKLSQKEGKTYRLPTEAEWEYACRAGRTGKYCSGGSEAQFGDYAWYLQNSGKKTHPVGTLKPNAWGLYDMYGNVWEWCGDWYGEYSSAAVTDPQGPSKALSRILRGGSWESGPSRCRSANRSRITPGGRLNFFGFRIVVTLD